MGRTMYTEIQKSKKNPYIIFFVNFMWWQIFKRKWNKFCISWQLWLYPKNLCLKILGATLICFIFHFPCFFSSFSNRWKLELTPGIYDVYYYFPSDYALAKTSFFTVLFLLICVILELGIQYYLHCYIGSL